MTTLAILLSCGALGGWIYLAFMHAGFWQLTLDEESPEPEVWPTVDIIVPARNETKLLPISLRSLLEQNYPGQWRLILIDDHSNDGTAALAQKIGKERDKAGRLAVLQAPDLQPGWSGKVAAMQAGVAQSTAEYILFTDADIEHTADSLRRLVARATERKFDLVSRMVKLHCETPAERLLIPAFVFFFSMLYPFRDVNDFASSVAAAAGGVMLVRRKALDEIGGLVAIKSALIDDCSLAKAIKAYGGPMEMPTSIELTLSREIQSLRVYQHIEDIWKVVARTAYTQLHYSPLLLAGTVVGMSILFLVPPLLPLSGAPFVAEIGLAAWLISAMVYMPTIRFYELHPVRALTLPLAGIIYVFATIDSGRLYWQGKGGEWKGRAQA